MGKEELHAPLVSVVVPVFNGATTVAYAIESALDQRDCRVQVVVVDDGSTDTTVQVVERLAKKDDRIALVRHEENKGRLEARRSGVAACTADYVMFLDADDTLAENAAATCMEQQDARGNRFDIVQLGFELRYEHYVDDEARKFDFEFCQPPECEAFGEDVTHVTFARRLGPWSMCGKMFARPVLQQAFDCIVPASMQTAEDACIYFVASYYAQSFKGVPACLGYIYNIDSGGSDAKWAHMDAAQFAYSCGYIDAMQQIRRFLDNVQDGQMYNHDYDVLFHEHARSVAFKLLHNVQRADIAASLCCFADRWPAHEIAACIAENELHAPDDAWRKMGDAPCLQTPARPVKTIAAYHNRVGLGGAESAMLQLAQLWLKAGYNVVLITDEGAMEDGVALPEGVHHAELVPFQPIDAAGIRTRMQQLDAVIETYHVDALVYHQWWNPLLPWDMLLAKLKGVPVLVHAHSTFRMLYSEASVRDLQQQVVLRYADGLAVLSATDERYWSAVNPRVWQTQNPITLYPVAEQKSPLETDTIVWVGRLSRFDKQPQEALAIMARVVEQQPAAHMVFVGPSGNDATIEEWRDQAACLGIAEHVEFAGAQEDIASYLHRSSVFLLTSRFEGYCFSFAEAMAAGLPCVAYNLPYLSLMQENEGVVTVPQGDSAMAAQVICKLLEDDSYKKKVADAAFAFMQQQSRFDYGAFWVKVFDTLAEGSASRAAVCGNDMLWDVVLDGCKDSVATLTAQRDKANEDAQVFRDSVNRVQAQLDEERASTTHKLGAALLYVPCRLKDMLRR